MTKYVQKKLWAQAQVGDQIMRDNAVAIILSKKGNDFTRSFVRDHTKTCETKSRQQLEADGWIIVGP